MPPASDNHTARPPKTADVIRLTLSGDPAMPAPNKEEEDFSERFREVARLLQQMNLNNAVCLAREACRGEGTLVAHFAELGRRFGATTLRPEDDA